jgi:hypothetical protein
MRILFKIYLFFKEWNDFYDGSPTNTEFQNLIQTTHLNLDPGNIFIKHVQFQHITDAGPGGALKFTASNGANSVLIEKSLFYNCKTRGDSSGGSIYFSNFGYLIIHQTCGYNGSTGGSANGQFCYSHTNSNNQYNISLILSSIIHTFCNSYGYTLLWYYGTKTILNTNISNNQVKSHCPAFEFLYHISYISFSSIENNIANLYAILSWKSDNVQSFLVKSNIINNSQDTTNHGIFWYFEHNINLIESLIIQNKANSKGKLVYRNDAASLFTIIDCYIDSISISNSGECIIQNTLTQVFSNFLFLYIIDDCLFNYKNLLYFHHLSKSEIELLLYNLNQSLLLTMKKYFKTRCCYHNFPYHQLILSTYIMIQTHP